MSGIYDRLKVQGVINGAGTLTRLSGTLLDPAVCEAMIEASRSYVRIDQLQVAVGRRIAELTGAEAALVTSGAAAAVTLAAAAALCGLDRARMGQLPDTSGVPNEIIIPRSHRNGYDHALRAAGARLVEVGLAERTRDPQPWEIEAAITPSTVAIAYAVGFSPLALEEVVSVAHQHGLPVLVDASATLPPKKNLRTYIDAGADLVCYSGGKGIRGPQASGILCGRRKLIASAALQMWDMDYLPELWDPPAELIDREYAAGGVPNHGIGRAFKVGREEIVGLWAALERFVDQDEAELTARLDALAERLARDLAGQRGLSVSLVDRGDLWRQVRIDVNAQLTGVSAVELARRLAAGHPPVYLIDASARQGILGIDPFSLQDGDAATIVERIGWHLH